MCIRDRCLNDELIALRRDFHQHPEIGGKEFRTSQIVEKYLQDLGLETQRMADTGIVATLYGNHPNGKTILLRADMDALFVEEENEVPYKSVNPGVMHACGHDGHTAMPVSYTHLDVYKRQGAEPFCNFRRELLVK